MIDFKCLLIISMILSVNLLHIPVVNSEDASTTVIGELKVFGIQIEFSDHRHNPDADDFLTIMRAVNSYVKEASYGKTWLSVDKTETWLMMPKTWASYKDPSPRTTGLVSDAIYLADPYVDFSVYKHIYIWAAGDRDLSGPVFASGGSFYTDEGPVELDIAINTETSALTFGHTAHEFMHTFGLPDLYYFKNPSQLPVISPVGRWSLMDRGAGSGFYPNFPDLDDYVSYGYARSCTHIESWSKIRLGWIASTEIFNMNSGDATVTIDPTEVPTRGFHAIKIPVKNEYYYLVEVRQKIGFDNTLPDEGVLITLCNDQNIPYVKVVDAHPDVAYLFGATFKVNESFEDPTNNLKITVISVQGQKFSIRVEFDRFSPGIDDSWVITTEVAIVATVSIALVICVVSYWVLKKRR